MYRGSQRRFQTWTSVLTVSWCMALSWMQIIRYVAPKTAHQLTLKVGFLSVNSCHVLLCVSLSGFQGQCLPEKAKVLCWPCHGLQTVSFCSIFVVIFEICKDFYSLLTNVFSLVAVGIPFHVSSSQRRRWRPGELCTESSTSCIPPTPAGNTWRTCHCCPNTVNFERTTSLSWKMCHASSEVNFISFLKHAFF